ncbi:hypothetical protein RchiOBHm_Chr5g0027231 [Rosa chinensis]|uniref:Uncharacterized protein n=2 Tax=Rosa chinensis TaxID=74649 RepID=A0A2P6Q922_ROSCH|nr:hypothetical protein RchiOBHm_Chr5g0027231 [Rosa chinensis]
MVLFKKAQVSHHRSCTKLGVMTASQRNIRPNMLIGGYRHNWDLVNTWTICKINSSCVGCNCS